MKKKFLALIILIYSHTAFTMTTYEFRKLRGYTVSAITQIQGDFHGCSQGKKIKLQNGWSFTCMTDFYDYVISPDVIIFSFQQGSIQSAKAVINSRVFDISLIAQ